MRGRPPQPPSLRRGQGRFSTRPIHERLIVNGPTGRLVNPLHHILIDHGEKIADGTPDEVRANQDVIDAYLGVSHD